MLSLKYYYEGSFYSLMSHKQKHTIRDVAISGYEFVLVFSIETVFFFPS